VVVFAVVSVVVVVVSVVVVCVCVVLELIGAGVSTIAGAGAGVSAITGAGAGSGVITVVSVVVELAVVDGYCVTVTSEPVFFGTRFTFVFVPTPEPLPVAPTELLVYARPVLSTAAGPEITAGVVDAATPSVFAGA
jgi:hypothetical protein